MNVNCNMNDCEPAKARPSTELERLYELSGGCSPEFLVRASRPMQSTARDEDPEALAVPTVSGRFVASRGILMGEREAENLVQELRERLGSSQDEDPDEAKEQLLGLWMIAERCLVEAEINELRPAVFRRLFGEDDVKLAFSRGGQRQGGGY